MNDLPMKPSVLYPAQINIKVEQEIKDSVRHLSNRRVAVNELLRKAIKEAIKDALEKIDEAS